MLSFLKVIADCSPIYWNPWIYRIVMRFLYGRTYEHRYGVVAEMVPPSCSVTDLCCGCGFLYTQYLIEKEVDYTGVDMFPTMLSILKRKGAFNTIAGNVLELDLVSTDYCIMIGSLYHFYPREDIILNKMAKIGSSCILLESVRRPSVSKRENPILGGLSRKIGYVRNMEYHYRLDSVRLDQVLEHSEIRVLSDDLVVNGIYRRVIFEQGTKQ